MNCPGLSVAHQRDIRIKMSLFWKGGWSMWFGSLSPPHFRWQNIPDISIRKDTCIMSPVKWLETSLHGYIISWNSHQTHRRIGVLFIQTHQDSAFHSMDKKMEISVVDLYFRQVSKGWQAHLTPKVKVLRSTLIHPSAEAWVCTQWVAICWLEKYKRKCEVLGLA